MVSDLYKRHFYVNKSIDSLVNNEIIEYDMKSADISIIESKGLLSEEEIKLIKSLPKKVRNTKIGKMQIIDHFKKWLNNRIIKGRYASHNKFVLDDLSYYYYTTTSNKYRKYNALGKKINKYILLLYYYIASMN